MISAINCSTCDTPPRLINKEIEGYQVYYYQCLECHKKSEWSTNKEFAAIYWNEKQIKGNSK